jgi:hypothetical protein
MKYLNTATWTTFGKPIKAGDRLTITKIDNMNFSQMKEDKNGVFIFLPNKDHKFYNKDNTDTINQIKELIKKLK